MKASELVRQITELIEKRGDLTVRLFVPEPDECPLVVDVDIDKFDDDEGWVFVIEGAER